MKRTKYFVEIQSKEDFDNIIIQSQWFDTIEQAKKWFSLLEFCNKETCTATIMKSDFDENEDYGDILFEEILID